MNFEYLKGFNRLSNEVVIMRFYVLYVFNLDLINLNISH